MSFVDLKERIATSESFSPKERDLLLSLVNAIAGVPDATQPRPAAAGPITFTLVPHVLVPDRQVVEIASGGHVCATLTAVPGGIKLLSAHIASVVHDEGGTILPVPALIVRFAPGPWRIQEGKIERER